MINCNGTSLFQRLPAYQTQQKFPTLINIPKYNYIHLNFVFFKGGVSSREVECDPHTWVRRHKQNRSRNAIPISHATLFLGWLTQAHTAGRGLCHDIAIAKSGAQFNSLALKPERDREQGVFCAHLTCMENAWRHRCCRDQHLQQREFVGCPCAARARRDGLVCKFWSRRGLQTARAE